MNVEQRLSHYIATVEANDIEALEEFYDADFCNIRYDRSGACVELDRATFLNLLHRWRRDGQHPLPEATDTKLIATSFYSEYASSLLLRIKGGQTLSYNLVWRQHDHTWKLAREFTFHEAMLPVVESPNPGDEREQAR